MQGLELVVVLGAAVLACGALARRTRVAPPVLLLGTGVLLGFAPALRGTHLPPEAVLLLFLPALLWWESQTTSLREIRRFLRVIVLLGSLLVVLTAAGVAAAAHALGVPWGPAWVLGAAVAPTDATAVGVLARSLPRRNTTVLRAESLVNDGTALVVYGLAVGAVVGDQELAAGRVAGLFALSYAGGVAAGLLVAWVLDVVRRRLDDPLLESVAFLLTPFAAFLLAELVYASGVLAVVAGGLLTSRLGPRTRRADARQQSEAFWRVTTYLLNGGLFVLVGLEVQSAVRGLSSVGLRQGVAVALGVTAAVVGVRFAWLWTTPYLIRALDRRPAQRDLRAPWRSRVVSGVAGFRGAVSLAAALAVPQTTASGAPFPERDVVVFATVVVIVLTLVVQAPLLPAVVRWARLPPDTALAQERLLAQQHATRTALEALPGLAAQLEVDDDVAERVRREFLKRLLLLEREAEQAQLVPAAGPDGSGGSGARGGGPTALAEVDAERVARRAQDADALRLALLHRKREAVVGLRDDGHIDDTVLRQVQHRLDLEEVRLSHREQVE
ncbi:Na+/H+ antiporter [Quadrisphaera oryzae]|uniref:Na+/H+ antiporter n=1 Tax=Quadrisphaera TaxID=317661 RepID=UPI0016491E32|nr:Na+/H+ antiporter [Quadrisphaera sp. RL12-1S]